MADVAELAAAIGGGGGAAFVGKYLWDRFVRREEKDEHQRDSKLDTVLSKLSALELDMRSLVEKSSMQTGAVAEVKARVEGISTNHGSRIGQLEQTIVELRTRIVALEDKRRR